MYLLLPWDRLSKLISIQTIHINNGWRINCGYHIMFRGFHGCDSRASAPHPSICPCARLGPHRCSPFSGRITARVFSNPQFSNATTTKMAIFLSCPLVRPHCPEYLIQLKYNPLVLYCQSVNINSFCSFENISAGSIRCHNARVMVAANFIDFAWRWRPLSIQNVYIAHH